MTSSLRRALALKILVCLDKHSLVKCNSLASRIRTLTRKQFPPQLVLPIPEINAISGDNFDENSLIHCLKQLPVSKSDFNTVNEERCLCVDIEANVFVTEVLNSIISSDSKHWLSNVNFCDVKNETVIVEYSSPNIAKPFHAGHLRSTVLGNFIANVYEKAGHSVQRINYLGDWGSQFGVLSKGFQKFGDDDMLVRNPLQHLYEVYVKSSKLLEEDKNFKEETRAEFRALESGHESSLNIWKRFQTISKEDLNRTYKEFGIHFDAYEGESLYNRKANDICNELLSSGLARIDDDGAVVYDFNHPSGMRKVVLRKSDGTNLYLTRDIAAAIDRMERYKFGKMFYVVENGQHDHFLALFNILKSMKKAWADNLTHVKFGRVRGMSTRSGNVVFLKDILREAESKARSAMELSPNTRVNIDDNNVAQILGASSLIVNDMRSRRLQDIDFSWDRTVQTKGDSGIFLHYVYARLCSLESNCGVKLDVNCDLGCLFETQALDLISCLSRYEDVIYMAYESLEPSVLLQYLFRLGHHINGALKVMRVKGENVTISQARLLLLTCAKRILADGMLTVGIRPLESI